MEPIIFISHAAKDKELVDELFDLLQLGCDLRQEEIFCSSVEAAGIETGQDFIEWIENKLEKSQVVIIIASPNYVISQFCLAELGAAWILHKNVFPLVLPGQDRSLKGVFQCIQTANLDGTGIDGLRDAIARYHSKAATATPRWNLKRKKFLRALPEILEKLPPPDTVTWERFEEEKQLIKTLEELYSSEEAQRKVLEKQVTSLLELKDVEESRRVIAETLPEKETYEELLKDIRSELDDLSDVEIRCLYAYMSDKPWEPAGETYEYYRTEFEKAIQSDCIVETTVGLEGGYLTLNEDHPKFKSVLRALGNLQEFFEAAPHMDLIAQIGEEEKCIVDLANWEYWDSEIVRDNLLR